jgi:hypothetical protein
LKKPITRAGGVAQSVGLEFKPQYCKKKKKKKTQKQKQKKEFSNWPKFTVIFVTH